MLIKKLAVNRGKQTVFSLAEIARITGREANRNLISAVSYYVKSGDLVRLAKGLYALDKDYLKYELGNKLRTPSYVGLYTILQDEAVIFQPYTSIFLVSFRSEVRVIDGQKFIYRKIKDDILLNPSGIKSDGLVMKATLERAILDKIYLDGEEHLDNLRAVDWDKMEELNEQVYGRKNISKYIEEMREYVR
ncbi:MAG: type IV toxin-antitoxin system AbiEi family antitoxin domain-containing protein [Candidatus Beckwithbacteria bacterium]|nr:type IV toxin-antitoxin system AbiEi family antitoxin domain-containing protein [Patescibacteria group bacterium]